MCSTLWSDWSGFISAGLGYALFSYLDKGQTDQHTQTHLHLNTKCNLYCFVLVFILFSNFCYKKIHLIQMCGPVKQSIIMPAITCFYRIWSLFASLSTCAPSDRLSALPISHAENKTTAVRNYTRLNSLYLCPISFFLSTPPFLYLSPFSPSVSLFQGLGHDNPK